MRFGFVGLGQMGLPMAKNLARASDVIVYDRKQHASDGFSFVADSPKDLTIADVIILSLPDVAAVRSFIFGNGFFEALKPRTIIVDTGTTDVSETIEIAGRLEDAGLIYLDAPVSGMQARAETGNLTMMVGGPVEVLQQLTPAFDRMADKILHMGPVGAGQTAKLINQLLFDVNVAALAEIMPLASVMGLDAKLISDVVNSGTGRSWASEFFLPRILKGDFSQGYALEAAYKDIVSGARLCAERRIPNPVLAAASATYKQALREGHGKLDKGAMILVFERLLNISFRTAEA